jgi:ATP-dependent DNA helicase RecG
MLLLVTRLQVRIMEGVEREIGFSMIKSDLLQLIANGENSGVEFKRDDLRPEQLAKEIVALANLKGGKVLLGVEDDGSISGIQRNDLESG